ncbi:hypothetical protein PR048_011448 [Dryococelus australis]|uniref:HTH psq-type domain-containing protein n=1 Tax=Dryococelus australis TaxID=614101 RepID=A0ABQ9HLM6_9NEOP|nr:hypothetical protein PR048_011448 [Dryococelus australis]
MSYKKKRHEKDGVEQIYAKQQMCVGKTYRKYSEYELKEAAKLVIQQNVTIYKAAKVMNTPWSSLKRFIANNDDISTSSLPKMWRGFFTITINGTEIVEFDYRHAGTWIQTSCVSGTGVGLQIRKNRGA